VREMIPCDICEVNIIVPKPDYQDHLITRS
jgi:hypothetical protein